MSSKNKEFFKKEKVVVDNSPYNKKKLNLQVKTSIAIITITKEMVVVDNLKEILYFFGLENLKKFQIKMDGPHLRDASC